LEVKKILILYLLIFCAAEIHSQNYTIYFTGIGASTVVDSVKVENLTQCTDTTINGSDAFQCYAGDTLKLTGNSGIYRTIFILVPTQTQTVTFSFTDCTDGDNNHYAVVQIGSQLWMAENLKTTQYQDGSGIPNVPDSASWRNTTSGAYCDYHNLPGEGDIYGHLYNFYAVADSRDICPSGWHVATNSEWNIMEKFLDNTVDTTALAGTGTVIGKVLKENCNTRWAYNPGTWGSNESGFTALCTNYRIGTGAWSMAPNNDHDDGFWTSTSFNSGSAWFRSLRWCFNDIYVLYLMKTFGYSVRCIKNSGPTNTNNINYRNRIKIYPNPAKELFYIDCAEKQAIKMQVYNMIGECVVQKVLSSTNSETDIRFLPKGVYMIKLTGPDLIVQEKIVKE
jgi:uncharacterized protein (TIGR02145 family)